MGNRQVIGTREMEKCPKKLLKRRFTLHTSPQKKMLKHPQSKSDSENIIVPEKKKLPKTSKRSSYISLNSIFILNSMSQERILLCEYIYKIYYEVETSNNTIKL